MIDAKNRSNTTVVRHFASHDKTTNPRMTIHILEYIWTLKDATRSNSLRDRRDLVWVHRLHTIVPNGLNILN